MAVGSSGGAQGNLDDLEKEMFCGICHEYYSNPRVLPCLHYYCKHCIDRLVRKKKSVKIVVCPECRKESDIEDIDKLPPAVFVNSIQSILSALKAKKKILKDPASHAVKDKGKPCPVHYDEPLTMYCFDCATLICRDCIFKDHKEHNYELCDVAADQERTTLEGRLKSLCDILYKLQKSLHNIQITEGAIGEQEVAVVDTINTSFDKLSDIIEKRRRALLQEVKSDFGGKKSILSIQTGVVNSLCSSIMETVDNTERFIAFSDNELMNMHAEIRNKVDQEVERYDEKKMKSIQPKAKADVGVEVKCIEEIQQLCQTKAKIVRLAVDTPLGTVTGKGTETAVVNEVARVTLIASKESTDRRATIVGELKSLYDGSVVKCEVEQSGDGKYRIQYTPTVRGRHELTVAIDGKNVSKDAFSVFVSPCPDTLGKKPIKVWKNINRASGVSISHEGEPIATEYFGSIKLMKQQDEEPVCIVSRESARLNSLCGLATDEKGNIYCTDAETSSVMVFNLAENKVDTHSLTQKKGPGHWGITIVDNKIMMCECNNKGSVVVYSKNWKYLKCIEQGSGQFMDVSSDNNSNIYVTDYVNASVLMFNKDLSFLRSFGSGGGSRGRELVKPYGLCVSGQFIYVSNWGSGHNVTIFTLDGVFVSSFGRRGNKEGNFDSPCGVCVDRDGFVVVADYGNSRVQCF